MNPEVVATNEVVDAEPQTVEAIRTRVGEIEALIHDLSIERAVLEDRELVLRREAAGFSSYLGYQG